MSGAPPPYQPQGDWKFQRRAMREQARAERNMARDQWKMYRDQQRAANRRSRGTSIVGPLILIMAGVVFLLLRLGRLSYEEVGAWYGRWWPMLLVTAGVVLLAEWAFDRNHADEEGHVPRARLGPGVITLLFLLCIPGIGLSISHGDPHWLGNGISINEDNLDEFLGDRHESDQVMDQEIAAGSGFSVENPHGDVTIVGGTDDGMVHVAIHKQVFARSDGDATAKAERLSPVMTKVGGEMALKITAIDGARSDVTISLPTITKTTVMADHGNVHISTIKADINVTANHGDVELNGIGGGVRTHMNSKGASYRARGVRGDLLLGGDCRDVDVADVTGAVSLGGDFFGKTHLERVGGSVRFHTSRTDFQVKRLDGTVDIVRGELSADQVVGPVSLSARSYNVTLDRVAGDVSVTTSDGSVDVTSAPPLGNITVQDRNGSVSVTVPEDAGFMVDAETRDGDVETDLPLTRSEDHHSHRLTGTVGSGKSTIRINTTQNDISLKKGRVLPLAQDAPTAPEIVAAPTKKNSSPSVKGGSR